MRAGVRLRPRRGTPASARPGQIHTTLMCGHHWSKAKAAGEGARPTQPTNHGVVPYRPSEVDFLIAGVILEDAWFILPIEARFCD